MQRRATLSTSTRSATVDRDPADTWAVVGSGRIGPQWYVDAAPSRFRGALDRLVGGGPRVPPPGRDLLSAGDRAGFWEVVEADHDARSLLLEARVRAPGRVRLEAHVEPEATGGSRVGFTIAFAPDGVLGVAYLLADLPARGAVAELTMLHLLTVLRRH